MYSTHAGVLSLAGMLQQPCQQVTDCFTSFYKTFVWCYDTFMLSITVCKELSSVCLFSRYFCKTMIKVGAMTVCQMSDCLMTVSTEVHSWYRVCFKKTYMQCHIY
jgi:hypothetical protein